MNAIEAQDLLRSGWALDLVGVGLWMVCLYTIVLWALGIPLDIPAWAL
mgnify:FL=1